MSFTTKEISRRIGVSTATLRYYDRYGICRPSRRDNGYRNYDENDIRVLKYAVALRHAGFRLEEIKRITDLFGQKPSKDCGMVAHTLVTQRVAELQDLIDYYEKAIDLLKISPPLMSSLESYLDHRDELDSLIDSVFDDIQSGVLAAPEGD